MFRTKFVAVCGSVGKSTTKEILTAILREHASVASSSGTRNNLKFGGLPASILQVRPWHRFAVIEVGIESRGDMARMAAMVRPDVVVMLAVKECHLSEFKSKEGVANEKADMVRALGADGTMVLNGDDPLVRDMVPGGGFRRIEFGCNGQPVRAENIASQWPDRLSFDLVTDEGRFPVRSRLVGSHWVTTVLAAIATARVCGISTEAAAASAASTEPFWARMQPVTLENGVTFLRDEFNGAYDTFLEAFKFLAAARATRKIAVISQYSDSHQAVKPRQRIKRIARAAAEVVDILIVVDERSNHARDAAIAAGMAPDRVYAACDVREASDILTSIQRTGDLVLLKGRTSQHLSRVYLDQIAPVTCRLESCQRQHLCDRCGELGFSYKPAFSGRVAPPDVWV